MDANLARGMSPSEARRTALRDLGGMTQATEAVRAVRTTWLDGLWRDIRHGIRALGATPAFTIVALAVLTLSIGATTAIFSVVDAVMLRGLPFRDSGRLVTVGEQNLRDAAGPGLNLVAPQNFLDWRAQQTAFTGLAAIGYAGISLKAEGGQEPETLEAQAVTADFFPVLGTAPLMGRTFTADNEVNQGAFAVVISYGLWQRRFGGAPDVIGRRLPGQQADFEILGVMPRSFAYPVGATRPTEVWLPNVFRPRTGSAATTSPTAFRSSPACATASRWSRPRHRWTRSPAVWPRRRRAGSRIGSPRSSRCATTSRAVCARGCSCSWPRSGSSSSSHA